MRMQEMPVARPGVDTRHFTVAAQPTLILNNQTGSLHVQAGPSENEVIVQAVKYGGLFGETDDFAVRYTQDMEANTITITVDSPPHAFDCCKVTFEVTVPRTATLRLKTTTGSIDVRAVSGEMVLSCDTGSIDVQDGTVQGQTRLMATTGSVTFDGAIAPDGSYRFETTSGAVNVTLPRESAFHVKASTMSGALRTDFPGVTVQDLVGHQASGDVGDAPRAMISLRTLTGSIKLYQR